ncbi:secondary thiamine-phosphate synthase enzyme [Tenacibaculum sp. MAR_2009_124]|uniref:secondary thiamine-phosphate synthase enzyme YjbQ n=1 Tax=Tenacibaculum sp. MAR_2009_124 TaxID=1250059 RepID=UPI000895A31B|nr:secondary thiamine-phosphate synthase enzyme YjbQ [Tenacibaculum sp. MAR_2009_124]SEC88244.1 secondary thiamine-phosphate synthase enzyme [Tenacibaculum sp. MAR_2009_124]
MKFYQKEITLPEFNRGYHLITKILVEHVFHELRTIKVGQFQVFLKHTSASLTINENADPTVRIDFETHINKMIPENMPYYKHDYEGADDMPAHIKSSMLGCHVSIPISNGKLNLGIWQGVYLGEHRNYGGKRKIVLTIIGEQ